MLSNAYRVLIVHMWVYMCACMWCVNMCVSVHVCVLGSHVSLSSRLFFQLCSCEIGLKSHEVLELADA